jgi:hypothetical protein
LAFISKFTSSVDLVLLLLMLDQSQVGLELDTRNIEALGDLGIGLTRLTKIINVLLELFVSLSGSHHYPWISARLVQRPIIEEFVI